MTVMGNIHDHHKGLTVRALDTRHRAHVPGFTWANYEATGEGLVPIIAGRLGTITDVESHGANPWTRYGVLFEDGTRANGLILGSDIEFA